MAGHSRPKDGVASLARSRPKDGVASLAYVPAIHTLLCRQDVDARHKAGHDGGDWCNLGGKRANSGVDVQPKKCVYAAASSSEPRLLIWKNGWVRFTQAFCDAITFAKNDSFDSSAIT